MEYKIRIEPLAYSQILEAVDFLKNVSYEAAEKLYDEIIKSIKSLKDLPFRYPVDSTYNVAKDEERKMILGNGRYFILYCIENDAIQLISVKLYFNIKILLFFYHVVATPIVMNLMFITACRLCLSPAGTKTKRPGLHFITS